MSHQQIKEKPPSLREWLLLSVVINVALLLAITGMVVVLVMIVDSHREDVFCISLASNSFVDYHNRHGTWPAPGKIQDSSFYTYQMSKNTPIGREDIYETNTGTRFVISLRNSGLLFFLRD